MIVTLNNGLGVTFDIEFALTPQKHEEITRIMNRADRMMELTRNGGGSCEYIAFFWEEIHEKGFDANVYLCTDGRLGYLWWEAFVEKPEHASGSFRPFMIYQSRPYEHSDLKTEAPDAGA